MKKQNCNVQSFTRSIGNWTRFKVCALMLGSMALATEAGVIFYTSPGSFDPAVTAFTLRGTEAWNDGGASAGSVSNPLQPGVSNGPFPTGSSAAVGVKAQSNSLGNSPTNASPGSNMFYAPAGFAGVSGNVQPSKQISPNNTDDSFDIIFNTIGSNIARAVSFSPMYYRGFSANNSGTVTIRVYNHANQLIGTTTVPNVQDCLETAYLGVVTTGSDTLGRINVYATPLDTASADNIAVYQAPVLRPTLDAAIRVGNSFGFRLNGQPGLKYAVLASTNFVSWQSVQTNLLSSNSIPVNVITPNPFRFFRAQWLP